MKNLILYLEFILGFLIFINCSTTQDFPESRAKQGYDTNELVGEDGSARVKTLLNEGNDFFYQNKFSQAVVKFQEANAILATEEGYYLAGLCFFKKEEFANAKEYFERGLEINPRGEQILVAYALTLTTLGEEEHSLEIYSRLTKYYPQEEMYFFKQGVALKSLKRYADSYRVFKQIKADDFKSKASLFMHLGDVSFEIKKYSEAQEYFLKAKGIDPGLQEAEESAIKAKFALFLEKGNRSIENKEYTEAISNFALATNLNPKSALSFLNLGKAYFQSNQFERAEENLQKSIYLEKKSKDAYVYLSAIYTKKQGHGRAISNYLLALEIFPNDAELYNQLGVSYKKTGNSNRALLAFMKAKEIDGNHLQARRNLAQTLLEERKILEARREFGELSELFPKNKEIQATVRKVNVMEIFPENSDNKTMSEKKRDTANDDDAIQRKANILIKKSDSYLALGQKEKSLSFLKSAWRDAVSYKDTNILETIAYLYGRLGQESLAIKSFEEILEKKPESAVSYYQLGILSLGRDRQLALRNFEKAIVLKRNYTSAYIARGITYYKLGNRDRAREDFHYALRLESNLEIASYNLGMILYNDNLFKDAEALFLDLTKKYPNFADPYYHLGFIYFEQRDMEQAEKYILISLRLDRTAATIFAYIKILEEISKRKQVREGLESLVLNLKREIVEKYPNSSYAKNLSDSVFKQKENKVVIQKYPLVDILISAPIFINQTLIVNYGMSIARLHSDTKSILWRVETQEPYQWLKANTRLYGLSRKYLDQLDLETGKILWRVKLDTVVPTALLVSDSILYSGVQNGREAIYSYSFEGELQSSLILETGSKWEITPKGHVFVFKNAQDAMSWDILDSKLQPLKDSLTLLGVEKGEVSVIGSVDTSCYILKGSFVYRFEPNGMFTRSIRIEKPISALYLTQGILYLKTKSDIYSFSSKLDRLEKNQSLETNQTEVIVDNNTYLSSNGILKVRDKSGKLLWSENLAERTGKNKSTIFSVYLTGKPTTSEIQHSYSKD